MNIEKITIENHVFIMEALKSIMNMYSSSTENEVENSLARAKYLSEQLTNKINENKKVLEIISKK